MIQKRSIIIPFILIVFSTGCNNLKSMNNYMIAFIEEGSDVVRIRYSGEDPTDLWRDGGSIEGGRIPGTNHSEAGLGTNPTGGIGILGTLVGDLIELRVGFIAGFSKDPDETIPNAGSSPSIAHIDGGEYLLAYQYLDVESNQPYGWLMVKPYEINHSVGSNLVEPIPETDPKDVFLVGRPAIAYLKDQQLVLVVWDRSGASYGKPQFPPTIQYALGAYPWEDGRNTRVKWTEYGEFPISPNEYAPFYGSPSLATDGDNFYLGITRQEYSSGDDDALYNPEIFIYKSSNGRDWKQIAKRSCPIPYTYTDIAVQPDGEMLVGMITSGEKQEFYIVKDGIWTELDAQRILGRNGAPREFEIVIGTSLVEK